MPTYNRYLVYARGDSPQDSAVLAQQVALAIAKTLDEIPNLNAVISASPIEVITNNGHLCNGNRAKFFEIARGSGPNIGELCIEPGPGNELKIKLDAPSMNPEQVTNAMRQFSAQIMEFYKK